MAKAPESRPQRDTVPDSFPEVTPRNAQPTHDFTLQAVIEMQRSIGQLMSKTDRLVDDVKSQGQKVDELRHQATYIKGGMAVLALLLALATFFMSSKWDAILTALKSVTK